MFDASSNKWKLVDEKEHTDVFERIIENPIEEELLNFRRNITDETNIINNLERNTLDERYREKHEHLTDTVDHYIRSDHLIDESTHLSSSIVDNRKDVKVRLIKMLQNANLFKLNLIYIQKTKTIVTDTTKHKEQCICEMCTCG